MTKLFLVFFVIFSSICLAQDSLAVITVNVSNCNNDAGQIIAYMFSSADGFPLDGDKTTYTTVASIENGVATITFSNVVYGNYALVIIHDENMNNELNTNFIGKPTEQVWVSNDQRGGPFGGPDFEPSSFDVLTESVTLEAAFNF